MKSHLQLVLTLVLLMAVAACVRESQRGYWDDSSIGTATFTGVVMDSFGAPLEDVDICFHGTNMQREVRYVTYSDWDGSFCIRRWHSQQSGMTIPSCSLFCLRQPSNT